MLRLLNTKSARECEDHEWEMHCQETTDILDKIYHEHEDHCCKATFKYVDKGHKHREPRIMFSSLHDIQELIEYCDLKNGVDITTNEDMTALIIICYGQGYTIGDNEDYYYLIEEHIIIELCDESEIEEE